MIKKDDFDINIEFLRLIAITITIYGHFFFLDKFWEPYSFYGNYEGGVFLFYVISGFLASKYFYNSTEEIQGFELIKKYWIKRIFRLWPSAFLVSTITFIIFQFIYDIDTSSSYFFSILSVENFYQWYCLSNKTGCAIGPLWHYWSLSAEEQFYLFAPFLLINIRDNKYGILLLIFSILYFMITCFIDRPWGSIGWCAAYDILSLGIIAYILYKNHSITAIKSMYFYLAAQLIFVFLLIFSVENDFRIEHFRFIGYKGVSLFGLISILFLLNTLFYGAISNKRSFLYIIISWVGSRTYSIYLVHMPIFCIIGHYNISSSVENLAHKMLVIFLSIIISLLTAEFLYRFVETPMRVYGKGYAN